MTSRWRPSAQEERWLAVATELGVATPGAAWIERAGGWRSTGLLARIALFILGLVATALLCGIIGYNDESTLLIAGVAATVTAEGLAVTRRLFASGIEEGLCVAGFLLLGIWLAIQVSSPTLFRGGDIALFAVTIAIGLAGLRLLNPFVTTCAAIGFVYWVGSTVAARTLDQALGGGVAMTLFGCLLAALALALGAREYHRPSHDRMLDWLVVSLPVASYGLDTIWSIAMAYASAPVAGQGWLLTAAVLTALGAAMLFTGLRRRRHAPLLGLMGCVACLAVELRYVSGLPLEARLILGGLVALVAGIALDRYLREPRAGVTSAALTSREGPLDLLQTVGAAVLTQRTAPESARAETTVSGGGGRFGGGGASGSF